MLLKVSWNKQIHIIKSSNVLTLKELKDHIHQLFKEHPTKYYLAYIDEDNDEIILQNEGDYTILLNNELKNVKIIIKERSEDFYDETQKIELVELESPRENMNQIEQIMKNDSLLNEQSQIKNTSNSISLDQSIEQKLKLMLPTIVSKIKSEISQSMINNCEINLLKKENKIDSKTAKVVHEASCDGCGLDDIEGIRYKCSVCPDFDYCQKCQATICHPHPFLKIKDLSQTPIQIFAVIEDEKNSLKINGNIINCPRLSDGCKINNEFHTAQQFMRQKACPFMNPQQKMEINENTKTDRKQQKAEEKIQVKSNLKVEVKADNKLVESKPKIQQKQEKKDVKIQERDQVKINKQKKLNESLIIANANYLVNIAQIQFTEGYRISANHPFLTKQELLELYLNGGR